MTAVTGRPPPIPGAFRASGEALRLERVSKHFGKVLAVDELSLEIPAGAFVTLLGPSGCGKSTTLSLIAGLEQVDGGRIFLGDRDLTKEPPNERGMAMVFQNYALYPHMTVFENIAFSLKLRREAKGVIRDRVRRVAAMLGIDHLLGRTPAELSGGQQQRVALGRALVKEPVAFLLDEPFSNLDAALRAHMRTEVKHLHLRLGTTTIFVTHDQEEALVLSDLIAVMRDGKVVQYATQRDIYRRPSNLYVATFVGKPRMSLVEGVLDTSDGRTAFVAPGMRIGLDELDLRLSRRAGPVVLGVRAENVHIGHASKNEDGTDALRAEITLIEPVGSDTYLELDVHGTSIVARTRPDENFALGEVVSVSFSGDSLHLFDVASEERIVA